ncbi:unnamed protein product [Mytilus coruscus]|uniref:Endonuclease/exonuclease/phosphatase domain-containing protein n=1 Tax=Mytilus coruscus TaxID=42192 RepID=A0A6J8CSH0_MYTCO|nr:unnamed protein product [Mytilus coruscus]
MNVINIILLTSLLYNIGINLPTSKTWEQQQLLTCVLNKNMEKTNHITNNINYELKTSNYYEPLTHEISFESVSSSIFSPLKTSSPRLKTQSSTTNNSKNYSNKSRTQSNSIFNVNEKRNMRILTVNCRSIKDKTSVFKAAVNYITPDIMFGTESWLRGEKPGKTSTKEAMKSSKVFTDDYTAHRNDRGTLGGESLSWSTKASYQLNSSLVTNCEIESVKIHLEGKKLLIGSFYMPHRNMKCLDKLEKSLQMTANTNTDSMLTGDFNCPDINWESMSVPNISSDKEIQTKRMEITASFLLTQIHEQPTREDNLLGIVLTTNPSLVKTSKHTPGISDHEMIVTDCAIKPYY